tara:strand:- start:231 stop:479 length:249 start_codon:yes stop_codon:yes gene_type:complete
MPTRATEYSLYTPGKLVTSRTDLHSSSPIDGDAGEDNPNHVRCGTMGIILKAPTPERKAQYQVQFLKNIIWWVNASEIEPYL